LLDNGAELHEVRIDATDRDIYMLSPIEEKKLALHAKALVIDNDKVFIGSANLDPRSLRINTEMGLLIESAALNAEVRKAVTPDFSKTNSWQLEIDEEGGVIWVSHDATLTEQPAASMLQRIEDWFFSHRSRTSSSQNQATVTLGARHQESLSPALHLATNFQLMSKASNQ
jgi:putative cardiolipin synthase